MDKSVEGILRDVMRFGKDRGMGSNMKITDEEKTSQALSAIQSYYLEILPKKQKHSTDCLYVIEPRYYGNPSKEKYCSCGANDFNEAIQEIESKIKGGI